MSVEWNMKNNGNMVKNNIQTNEMREGIMSNFNKMKVKKPEEK